MRPAAPLLIVGNSVRYLAQSAARHGYAVTGVDLFGDRDTRSACRALVSAANGTSGGLVDACLGLNLPADTAWLYGAGFEMEPERMQRLESLGHRLGNSPQTLMLLARPERFFPLLDELGITYPAVSYRRPDNPRGWLLKRAGSFGGLAVRCAEKGGVESGTDYFQCQVPGSVCSLTFLANGRGISALGINRLHAVDAPQGDFRFAGATTRFNPGEAPSRQMIEMAQKLAAALKLCGANSIDCVVSGDRALLLELNARPPATLELYEEALPAGGVAAHIAACNGELATPLEETAVRGYRVCYAAQDLTIGQLNWPGWCSDCPPAGTRCDAGSPLCGLHASAASGPEVERLLRERDKQIQLLIAESHQEAA